MLFERKQLKKQVIESISSVSQISVSHALQAH